MRYQIVISENEEKLSLPSQSDPKMVCPDCEGNEVYGNGIDARELACPDCGLQYSPSDYQYRE